MFDPGLSLYALIIANLVMVIASALQASIGIGMALLALPFLVWLDPRLVPGPMLLAGAALTLISAIHNWHPVQPRHFGFSLLGLAVGTAVGAVALSLVNAAYMNKVFALVILLAVLLSVTRLHIRVTSPALFAGSCVSGVMGTMAGIHGPPLAIVLQHADPGRARAMMGALFFVAYLTSVAALYAVGLFGVVHLQLAACLLPGVLVGAFAARWLVRFVDRGRMRWGILVVSGVSAVLMLLN